MNARTRHQLQVIAITKELYEKWEHGPMGAADRLEQWEIKELYKAWYYNHTRLGGRPNHFVSGGTDGSAAAG